jgi:RNA polymerase sigma-70 factor (ECF subfamily)
VRGEESLDARVPDPIVSSADGPHPDQQLLLADSLSLALLVVLETLTPAERVAFVLHDMLAVSFDEIAPIVGRSPAAVRQLASRARRRVKRTAVVPDADVSSQREIIEAFLVAARGGDFEAIVALLDPNVILRADAGSERGVMRGARTVAKQALFFSSLVDVMRPALVNGSVGIVSWRTDGQPFSILALTASHNKIVEIDILADPARLQDLRLPASH